MAQLKEPIFSGIRDGLTFIRILEENDPDPEKRAERYRPNIPLAEIQTYLISISKGKSGQY